MAIEAADVRTRGDATTDQRTELRELLQTKVYAKEWRDRMFADVQADGGLTKARAMGVLNWLRAQPNLDGTPVFASSDEVDRIQGLLRTRVAPGPWARQIRHRIAAGTMTRDEAHKYLHDLERLPVRAFVAPVGPRPGTPAAGTPNGYFAVDQGDGTIRCYRVHTTRTGQLVVDVFTGPNAGQRRQLHGWKATTVLDSIAVDPAAAGRLFATTRKHCCDCNQPLRREDQPGFAHGVGFDCFTKRQAATTSERDDLRR